jgi:hypothetical protein
MEFWNVGEEGGEQYAEVIFTSTFINGVDSRVVTSTREDPEYGTMAHFEPSSTPPPDLPNYIVKLRFSGGPNGVFSKEDGTAFGGTKLTPDGSGVSLSRENVSLIAKQFCQCAINFPRWTILSAIAVWG